MEMNNAGVLYRKEGFGRWWGESQLRRSIARKYGTQNSFKFRQSADGG